MVQNVIKKYGSCLILNVNQFHHLFCFYFPYYFFLFFSVIERMRQEREGQRKGGWKENY